MRRRGQKDEFPRTARPAAGQVWKGPKTWSTDPEIGHPGYYALEDDGRTILLPPLLLTVVNVEPANEEDDRDLTIVADPNKPYHAQLPPHLNPPNAVALHAQVDTVSEVITGD